MTISVLPALRRRGATASPFSTTLWPGPVVRGYHRQTEESDQMTNKSTRWLWREPVIPVLRPASSQLVHKTKLVLLLALKR